MIGAFVAWGDSKTVGWIIQENGCHIWIGQRSDTGYGIARLKDDLNGKKTRAIHRVRYEQEIGPVPEGLELDHFVCDNKACCNPRHVRPVSHRENMLRSDVTLAALHAARTHCVRGLHPLVQHPTHKRRYCPECERESRKRSLKRRKRANGGFARGSALARYDWDQRYDAARDDG